MPMKPASLEEDDVFVLARCTVALNALAAIGREDLRLHCLPIHLQPFNIQIVQIPSVLSIFKQLHDATLCKFFW